MLTRPPRITEFAVRRRLRTLVRLVVTGAPEDPVVQRWVPRTVFGIVPIVLVLVEGLIRLTWQPAATGVAILFPLICAATASVGARTAGHPRRVWWWWALTGIVAYLVWLILFASIVGAYRLE